MLKLVKNDHAWFATDCMHVFHEAQQFFGIVFTPHIELNDNLFGIPQFQKAFDQGGFSYPGHAPQVDHQGSGLAFTHCTPRGNCIKELIDDFFQPNKFLIELIFDLIKMGRGVGNGFHILLTLIRNCGKSRVHM